MTNSLDHFHYLVEKLQDARREWVLSADKKNMCADWKGKKIVPYYNMKGSLTCISKIILKFNKIISIISTCDLTC